MPGYGVDPAQDEDGGSRYPPQGHAELGDPSMHGRDSEDFVSCYSGRKKYGSELFYNFVVSDVFKYYCGCLFRNLPWTLTRSTLK